MFYGHIGHGRYGAPHRLAKKISYKSVGRIGRVCLDDMLEDLVLPRSLANLPQFVCLPKERKMKSL